LILHRIPAHFDDQLFVAATWDDRRGLLLLARLWKQLTSAALLVAQLVATQH
jgi:putative aminopeptidase FrvX